LIVFVTMIVSVTGSTILEETLPELGTMILIGLVFTAGLLMYNQYLDNEKNFKDFGMPPLSERVFGITQSVARTMTENLPNFLDERPSPHGSFQQVLNPKTGKWVDPDWTKSHRHTNSGLAATMKVGDPTWQAAIARQKKLDKQGGDPSRDVFREVRDERLAAEAEEAAELAATKRRWAAYQAQLAQNAANANLLSQPSK
jgi:hypothetical protein